jgi:hypothetical protein
MHLKVHRAGNSHVKYAKCNRDPSFAFDYYVEVAIEWIVIVISICLEFLHVKEMIIYLFYYLSWSRGHIAALLKYPRYVLSHCIYRGQVRRDIEARVSKYPCKMQSILGQPVGVIRRCDESDDATSPISNQGIDIGGQLSSQVAGTYLCQS